MSINIYATINRNPIRNKLIAFTETKTKISFNKKLKKLKKTQNIIATNEKNSFEISLNMMLRKNIYNIDIPARGGGE